jgi:hypothetical protein
MRNSSGGSLLFILFAVGLAILVLVLFQRMWLTGISYLIKTNQSAGVPSFSSTQVSISSFPTARPPGHIGEGLIVGNIALYVTRVIRPADGLVGRASSYQSLKDDEEYLLVDISVNCRAENESCHLTEFDFGVRSASGRDVPAEFSSSFSGLEGLFEGGEIASGQNMSGSLIFVIHKDDSDLRLYYPRMLAFTGSAEFILEP